MFFTYGLPGRSSLPPATSGSKDKSFSSPDMKSGQLECRQSEHGRYRPPHLRKREGTKINLVDAQSSSDNEPSKYGLGSSDSDHSDSDGPVKEGDHYRSSKVRLAAIICIQVMFL